MRIPSLRSAPARLLLPLAFAGVAAAGCADGPTSAPQPEPVAEASLSLSGPTPIGPAMDVYLPPDNYPTRQGDWEKMQTTPGGGYYLIRVSGKVTHRWNPECAYKIPPVLDCPKDLDGAVLGPLDRAGAAGIDLGSAEPGYLIGNGRDPATLRLRPHPVGAFAFVHWSGGPQTIWARRKIFGGCKPSIWNQCADDEIVPQYFLSGGNQVEVLEVAEPAVVEAPAAVAPGQVATFTARIVDNLPVDRNVAGTREIRWEYLKGDTLPTPGIATPLRLDEHCRGMESCTYAPPEAGRMRMMAFINGYTVSAYSEIVRVRQAELKLTCPATVTRGETMTCSVAAHPSGTLTDIQWSFVDSAGHTIPGPTVSQPSWGGRMVVGGEMHVSALLDGGTATAEYSIMVRARTWRALRMRTAEDVSGRGLPAPEAITSPEALANSSVGVPPSYAIGMIDGGPNTGWSYLENEPVLLFRVQINGPAFQHRSAWARLQTGGAYIDPATNQRARYCSRSDLPDLLRLTREHEGSLSGSTPSHADAARTWLASSRREAAVEKLIVYRPSLTTNIEDAFDRLLIGAVLTAVNSDPLVQNHTSDDPPGLTPPAAFPCAARPWR